VPSITPDRETGIIDEPTLESLIGLDKEEVSERIGPPDYSGLRGHSYLMVYQGKTTYSTDLYVGAVGPYYIPVGGKTTTSTEIFHCYVIELDENHVVQGYNVIDNAPRGTRRDSSDEQVAPIADCAAAVLTPDERKEARIAELEARAKAGDTEAIIELAELTGNLAPMKVLANEGNLTLAFAVYKQLSQEAETTADAWRWLCLAANGSNGDAQGRVGHWHSTLVWQWGMERLDWLRDEVGIQPDNRVAYMWYILAAASGNSSEDESRESVAEEMTSDEIFQAEQMARDWKPGDCPTVEHRLSVPGET
jgi:hypothetical protein